MEITVRVGMPRVRRRLAVAAVVIAVAVLPGVALASHLYSDVPNSNQFHGNISAISGAGITVGCGGGKFCPDANLTRAQEAAFLSRGLPRVAVSNTLLDNNITSADGWVTIGSVTITVPGVGGDQFVVVQGDVTSTGSNVGGYPNLRVREANGAIGNIYYYSAIVAGYYQDVLSARWVFPATSGSHTYEFQATLVTGTSLGFINPVLTATTTPFGPTGQSSLGAPAPAAAGNAAVNGGN